MVVKCAFIHFFLLFLWIYSKSDMKITQPFNRMYETIYAPLWTSPTFSPFDFNTRFILHEMPSYFKFWMFITCEYFQECCCLINSPPHNVNAPLCPTLAVFQNNNRNISFLSSAKKCIFLSLIFLISLSFHILNLNPAILFLPSFPAHYLNLISPSML